MMKLKLIRPFEAHGILSDKELFSRISEDGVEYENYTMPDHHYVGIFVNYRLIGFWWLHPWKSTTMEIHCNILKPY